MSNSRKRFKNQDVGLKTKKQKVTGTLHYGLENQGATCYLNSVLQVLSMTTEMHDRLEPKSQITDKALENIFKKLKETTCDTKNITKSLEIENVHQQRDAAECLELIFNKISRQASEVFQGELAYTTKCPQGHSINEETNPFWTLPLSLKDTHDSSFSVKSGFERFFQPKLFNGDNMVYCNDCKEKTEAESGCEMVVFPQILTLLLKRFDFDYNTMTHVKSDHSVDVPRALQRKKKRYELYGMVNHHGSLRGGHYTATILSNEDNTWYEFDDTRVDKVAGQPFAETGTHNSSVAYLLAYRASWSLRDEVKEPDVDEQRDPNKSKEWDAHEKKNWHPEENQESGGRTRKEKKKQKRDAKHTQVVLSLNEDAIQEDVVAPQQTQNTSNSSDQHLDRSTMAEMMEKGHKTEEDENSQQLCKSSTCKNYPLCISLIVIVCLVVAILVVVLPVLYA